MSASRASQPLGQLIVHRLVTAKCDRAPGWLRLCVIVFQSTIPWTSRLHCACDEHKRKIGAARRFFFFRVCDESSSAFMWASTSDKTTDHIAVPCSPLSRTPPATFRQPPEPRSRKAFALLKIQRRSHPSTGNTSCAVVPRSCAIVRSASQRMIALVSHRSSWFFRPTACVV